MQKNLAGCYGVVKLPGLLADMTASATRSSYSHTFIMISSTHLVEAWIPRAHVRPLSDYAGFPVVFNTDEKVTKDQRRAVVDAALETVGTPYDLVHFLALALHHVLRLPVMGLTPMTRRAMICSHLVARAGASAGLDWTGGRPLSEVTPATLAERLLSF